MRQRDMRSERLLTLAAALGVAVVAVSCSTDGPEGTAPDDTQPQGTTSGPRETEPPDTEPPDTEPPDTEPGTGPQGIAGTHLSFFQDCPALLDYMQQAALERVTPWGLENRGDFYLDDAIVTEMPEEAAADTADSAATTGAADGSFSTTNTQEIGVDEGDIVETDGEYVYVVEHSALRVVAIGDPGVVATVELPDGAHQMLLAGDRLIVVTETWEGNQDTVVSSFDVSDPESPQLTDTTHLEGTVVATRAADGVARLVLTTSFHQRLDFVEPTSFGLDEDAALAENTRIIEESDIEDWLPRWFEEDTDGEFGEMQIALDCADVAAPADFSGLGITWIASIEMDDGSVGETPGSAGVVSTGSDVYASTDNLYIATRDWSWGFTPWNGDVVLESADEDDSEFSGPPPTLIHQFALGEGTEAAYVASGEVEGHLLDQFAMSEHDGDLRVATTLDGEGFGERTESIVTVLRPNGTELEAISSIGGLGKDERIYAVRFMGDTGYVVTFRQIDPLYVLDLSDPVNPVLEGELKIPGYSAYLHPVGEGLLLGVGQDATDRGQTLGTQLSLFDVSDPTNPERIDTLTIGGWSDVEWDHKAFLFWPPDGTIVLPISPGWGNCPGGGECPADEIKSNAGGAVVAELNGRELALRGTIEHASRQNSGCWNPLLRSIAIGDELVTVGSDQLEIADRQTLDERAAVRWGDPEDYDCYWWWEE